MTLMVKIKIKPANNQGFGHLGIILSVFILLVIGVAGWRVFEKRQGYNPVHILSGKSATDKTLAAGKCADPVFNVLPTARDDFGYLIPLGNINPPDHTLPTDHIYYTFNRASGDAPVPTFDVRVPGDVYLTRITYTSELINGVVQNFDYKMDFTPCGPVEAYYDHIHVLSPKLAQVFGEKPPCEDRHPRPDTIYRYCNKDLHFKMSAGELVGQAGGGKAAGFDFGATDSRSAKLAFANPKRGINQHTICPFDLYSADQKALIESKFQHVGPGPICGIVMQDIASTAQGNWYYGSGNTNDPESWQNDLALVHDNRDTTLGVLAVGGRIGQPVSIMFHPTNSGVYNRAFSEVQPGSTLYCYQSDANTGYGARSPQQHAIIQLVDDIHLKIELQPGACSQPYVFASPTTYER